MAKSDTSKQHEKTRFVQFGRDHGAGNGAPRPVNQPIVRASTVLHASVEKMKATKARSAKGERILRYGSHGTQNVFALEAAITEIERGVDTTLFPTGLAAIAHAFISILHPGDHLLIADSVYNPARTLATDFLPQRGVDCEFYSGGHEEVAKRLRPETRMVYLDNPGSLIYDIQDVPAIAELLKGSNALLAVDNTWGAAGLYRPIALGADISVIAITKYIAGHSDVMMGSVTGNDRCAEQLRKDAGILGQIVTPDDAYVALRGLRTAAARLAMQQAHTREICNWLDAHPLVARVLYPAMESDPGHALWKRDFEGANGLFSIEFKPHITQAQAEAFADNLELFGLGSSWGGYESLVMVYDGPIGGWSGGTIARLHIGLEDPRDLIADLDQALANIAG